MTRHRKPQRKISATGRPALALSPSTEWRELVDEGADLDEVAARLARAARWSCAGDATFDAGTVPTPTGDPATAIDSIDTWLLLADAGIERARYEGRRSWAWRQALTP